MTYAVNKGWLSVAETDQATSELAQILLEGILIVCAALAAGWLAIQQKLKSDNVAAVERTRTHIALTLPAGATFADVEAIRRNQNKKTHESNQENHL